MLGLHFQQRPIKLVFRLTVSGSHPNFQLPYPGMWAITWAGGGGGSGATHSGYADDSEHGFNGSIGNFTYQFRRTLGSTPSVGAGGAGGAATNNSDVSAQRGVAGGVTQSGIGTRNGGAGGRCAYEQTGLDATQPSGTYPASAYDTRNVDGRAFMGVVHNGGAPTVNGGRGAAGRTTPGQAGNTGTDGRIDYYLRG